MHLRSHVGRVAGSLLALALAAAVAAGCGSDATDKAGAASGSDTVTITHAQGEAKVPVQPGKVIVFDIASLDTIDALGAGDSVIGLPEAKLPEYLSAYADRDTVGSLFEPDYEAVAAADPDLIIIGGRSAETYGELAEIAPTIDLTAAPGDFMAGLEQNVTVLGTIFDVQQAATDKLAALDARIDEVKAAAGDAGTGLILMSSGGKLSAFGPGSRFGFIHDVLGVAPAKLDIKMDARHGEAASFEYVMEANPDWIFAVDRDAATGEAGASAKEVLDNELVAKTTAWKQQQVLYVNPVTWYIVGSGLTTVNEMVDEIGGALGA